MEPSTTHQLRFAGRVSLALKIRLLENLLRSPTLTMKRLSVEVAEPL